MPFTAQDADKHKAGLTDQQKKQWAAIANSVLEACISGGGTTKTCDAKAIIQANGAVGKSMKLCFKPIEKSDKQRYTLGIVYEPDVTDTHGDFASEDVIREAAWNFARELQGKRGIMNETTKLSRDISSIVRSGVSKDIVIDTDDPMLKVISHVMAVATGMDQAILTDDTLEQVTKLIDDGSPLGDQHEVWDSDFGDIVDFFIAPVDMVIGSETVTKGTWLMGVVWSEEMFEKIEKGERTGYSLGAFVMAVEVEE